MLSSVQEQQKKIKELMMQSKSLIKAMTKENPQIWVAQNRKGEKEMLLQELQRIDLPYQQLLLYNREKKDKWYITKMENEAKQERQDKEWQGKGLEMIACKTSILTHHNGSCSLDELRTPNTSLTN